MNHYQMKHHELIGNKFKFKKIKQRISSVLLLIKNQLFNTAALKWVNSLQGNKIAESINYKNCLPLRLFSLLVFELVSSTNLWKRIHERK